MERRFAPWVMWYNLGSLGTRTALQSIRISEPALPRGEAYGTAEDPYTVLDQEASAATTRNRCPSVRSRRTGFVRAVQINIDRNQRSHRNT